jgi:hypothetical protein
MRRKKIEPKLRAPARVIGWRNGDPVIEVQVVRRAPYWGPNEFVWLAKFRCPFCHRVHIHGLGGDPEPWSLGEPTHRVAHCHNPEPGGYHLFVTRGVVEWCS